jgi:hypothetical protein
MIRVVLLVALLMPSVVWAEGWVMVCPPVEWRDKPADFISSRVSQWTPEGAFDKAEGCENAKSNEIIMWMNNFAAMKNTPQLASEANYQYTRYGLCRCMPYDLWWRSQPAR